jgi:predicted alpha/beta-fold hydrolase
MRSPAIPCIAPFWARGRHLQTVAGFLMPSRPKEPPWERLNLKLSDGDVLRIRLVRGHSGVVVHLFHGLGGSADSDYVRRTASRLWAQGHTVLAINHRGSGEGRGLAARPYHMGCTADLAALLQVGRGFFPEHLQVAIGFSLSATTLLLLLGRDQNLGLTLPDRAIAVNPCIDPERTSLRLAQGFNRIYDRRFVHLLRQWVKDLWEFGHLEAPVHIPSGATLRDFDELFTARAAGFRDRADYYAQCTTGPHLASIQVPTVLLTAADDPFAPGSDLVGVPLSSAIHLHLEPTGGHMGYLGHRVPGYRWLDYALDHYLKEWMTGKELKHWPSPASQAAAVLPLGAFSA